MCWKDQLNIVFINTVLICRFKVWHVFFAQKRRLTVNDYVLNVTLIITLTPLIFATCATVWVVDVVVLLHCSYYDCMFKLKMRVFISACCMYSSDLIFVIMNHECSRKLWIMERERVKENLLYFLWIFNFCLTRRYLISTFHHYQQHLIIKQRKRSPIQFTF